MGAFDNLSIPSGINDKLLNNFIVNTLGNNFELLHEIVQIYLQETPDFLEKILNSTKTHSYYEAQSSAHNLKSNSATLGAMRMRELAELLENDCLAKKYDQVTELHSALLKEYQVILPTLTLLLNRNS